MLLEIKNLKVSYKTVNGKTTVLNNFELNMDRGDSIAIVGESGSGKSTLGGAIARLLPPSGEESGEIILNDQNLLSLTEEQMTKIRGTEVFMIFQNPLNSLNPVKTVGFQLSEAAQIKAQRNGTSVAPEEINKIVVDALKSVRLPDPDQIVKRYPHELSGGQVQRVVIAMALILRPKLLIADEPTTALDVTIQAQVINLLKALNKEYGMGIIFITHDLSLAYVISKKIIVMYAGTIMELNESSDLIKHPDHPYTIGLLKSVPTDYKTNTRLFYIKGSPPSFFNLPKGCRYSPRCDKAFGKCHEFEPSLIDVSNGHKVRCWLFE
ncbi:MULTISPECIES: ABC transporter ATP-binding protein [Acidiplasma]|uniref:Peptide ABC transporter ATP-binding protein n=2 Tax=Acidiplasma TaxID=507753 RepID=A0A0Q0RHU2_9ARCH|nr:MULTISPECIES: ABC transporter ATP-binding protein [Acidiplasma]KJE48619.1 peptide ABC transporter ATP-binding protein [Acidiplasma sp. MBA-1]KPV47115.1 peptide ABC transporter ATP-binding protein [Acidiplasma aeolicum]KQB33764.1 peptide ABC transporter ATP-binding protein [Acidiplasma aeolicum]KQB34871.1 peptide ABC transporter ATP-binding protein [Acidiplasma cupricumulans]WMT55365.1 MAG: ABC transporter ATP-binding protein [Acidiplasma sp.]